MVDLVFMTFNNNQYLQYFIRHIPSFFLCFYFYIIIIIIILINSYILSLLLYMAESFQIN